MNVGKIHLEELMNEARERYRYDAEFRARLERGTWFALMNPKYIRDISILDHTADLVKELIGIGLIMAERNPATGEKYELPKVQLDPELRNELRAGGGFKSG